MLSQLPWQGFQPWVFQVLIPGSLTGQLCSWDTNECSFLQTEMNQAATLERSLLVNFLTLQLSTSRTERMLTQCWLNQELKALKTFGKHNKENYDYRLHPAQLPLLRRCQEVLGQPGAGLHRD